MTKTKKVLHVLKSSWFSGAENIAITICKNTGRDYQTAYTSPKGSIEKRLQQDGVSYLPMDAFHIRNLRKVLKVYKPDIIHAHDFTAAVFCAILKRDGSLVAHLHNEPAWICRWTVKSVIFRIARHNIDWMVLVSSCIKDKAVFLKRCPFPCTVVGNPVETGYLQKMARQRTAKSFDLVFVGRLVEQKNPEKFIRIVSALCKRGIFVRAAMFGEGEREQACRKLILKLGMSDRIVMKGFYNNPYPEIKQAKLLLMTSRWEGFGLVAAEALVLGTPVLASRVGGLCDIFKDVPQALCTSEQEFIKKAGILLQNQKRYEQFCMTCRQKVRIDSIEDYMKKIDRIYEKANGCQESRGRK